MTFISDNPFLRSWSLDDIDHCYSIALAASGSLAWSKDHYASSQQASHSGWILFDGLTPVGCLVAQLLYETADLLDLQVIPERQGKGVAQQLFHRLLVECRSRNVERILLEVRFSNRRAISFYRRLGFQEIALRKTYYPASLDRVSEDALIMELVLS